MKMSQELAGAQEFLNFIASSDVKELFVYFSATKKENGLPWCPDCASCKLKFNFLLYKLNIISYLSATNVMSIVYIIFRHVLVYNLSGQFESS